MVTGLIPHCSLHLFLKLCISNKLVTFEEITTMSKTFGHHTTTTVYFNEVVFPSVLGSTSPMAFPQHFPPP